MTTATIGDNTKAERERRVLFGYYHRKDREVAAQVRALNEQKKSNRQNAKASGFPAAKLDHYLKSFLAEDQQKPVEKLKSETENLAWLGLIPDQSIKGDLFSAGDRVDKEAMIQAKGFHAGLNGLERMSGFDGGSADDKLWLASYEAGRAEYEAEIPNILARVEAARTNEEPADGEEPTSEPDMAEAAE